MSYIYNREIQLADTSQKDAFGRLRTSEITSLLELKHTYDEQPLLEDTAVEGTGEIEHRESTVILRVLAANDYVIRQSFNSAIYQPGKSQIFEASFDNLYVAAGKDQIKRVGYFTSNISANYDDSFDGFFLESNGTDGVKFCIYNKSTLITEALQSSWLTDDWDPANIDWESSQLMMVDYQWLGVGRVRFYLVLEGVPRLFYEYTQANNANGVYMLNPNQPIRYEIRANGGADTDSFVQICSQVSMEGSLNDLFKLASFSNYTNAIGLSPGSIYGILGFKIYDENYRGIVARLHDFSILQTSNDNYVLRIIKNPTFNAVTPTWNQLGPLGYDNTGDGTYTISLGNKELIIESFIGASGNLGGGAVEVTNSMLNPGFSINGTPDEYWITVEPLSNNASFIVSMNVEYYE